MIVDRNMGCREESGLAQLQSGIRSNAAFRLGGRDGLAVMCRLEI